MAVADDFPFLDDPKRLVGLASYRFTIDEFRAAARSDLANLPWNRSGLSMLVFYGFWHALLVVSAWIVIAGVRGVDGPFGPVDQGWAVVAGIEAYIAVIVLAWSLYGVPWRIGRLFRKFPGAGEEHALAFTADRWMSHGPLEDCSFTWEFVRDVTEFEDGFAFRLKLAPGTVWLPDHALASPFDHHAAAEFFRSKVPKYRVAHRRAS